MLSARRSALLVVIGVISSLSSALDQPFTGEGEITIEEVRLKSPKHTDYVKIEPSGAPRKLLKVVDPELTVENASEGAKGKDDIFNDLVSRVQVMGEAGHAATPLVQATKTPASETSETSETSGTRNTLFDNPCSIAARDYGKCRHENNRNRKLVGAQCASQHDLAVKCVMDNPTAGKNEPAAGG